MKHCYELPQFHEIECRQDFTRIEQYKAVLVKKGMAYKAFLKYIEKGDLKNIQRQINKGIITVL